MYSRITCANGLKEGFENPVSGQMPSSMLRRNDQPCEGKTLQNKLSLSSTEAYQVIPWKLVSAALCYCKKGKSQTRVYKPEYILYKGCKI